MNFNKVLAICLSPDRGGLELYFMKLVQYYKNHGHNIHVACSKYSYISKSIKDNKVECVQTGLLKTLSNFFILRSFIVTNKLTILHVSWSKDIFIALMLKLLTPGNIKIIFYRQMKIPNLKNSSYHKFAYQNIDQLLVITNNLRDEAYKNLPINRNKIKKLTYGIKKPDEDYSINKNDFIKKNNINPDIFSIGVFSRVEEQKGQHLVLEAMNRSSNEMQLCIIGHSMSKSYKDRLIADAYEFGLSNNLKFVDFVNSPMTYMSFFDLVILPTYEETFGLVVAEAMFMNVPVIGSNAGGVPEIISDGDNGLLFQSKNAIDLTKKIDMIFENSSLRDKLVGNAYEYAHKEYNYDNHFNQLEKIFDSL